MLVIRMCTVLMDMMSMCVAVHSRGICVGLSLCVILYITY